MSLLRTLTSSAPSFAVLFLLGALTQPAAGQSGPVAATDGKTTRQVVRVGAWLEAGGRGVTNVTVALPVPTDWPEQHVTMFEELIPDEVRRSEYRDLDTLRRLVLSIPKIAGGTTLEIKAMFEVTVHEVPYPERTDHLVIPSRPPREIRLCLGPSEMIESRKMDISKQAKSLIEGKEQDWDKVRALFDWVTTNIEIDKGIRETGALEAIRQLKGSPEDASYAFVAMCRSVKIPARMVWADNGEYAEFYLQDETGEGRWYPAVLEGKTEFGQMTDPRVIFQKGDNIKIPESPGRKLFVTETISGSGKMSSVRWVRDVLPARQR